MTRPIRLAISFALLGISGEALAQTAYDPAIAYTQLQGRTQYLYVANADGSHAVRVASSSSNINAVDFAPGGGRLVYSSTDGLRLLSYTASNSGVVVTGTTLLVGGGAVASPDFSPDGSRILYHYSGAYRTIPAAGGPSTVLIAGSNAGFAFHWLRPEEMGNAFAYLAVVPHGPNVPVDYEIRVVLMDSNDQVTSVSTVLSTTNQAFKAIEDFDIARTRNALVVSANYPTAIRMMDYDIGTTQLTDLGGSGIRVHYNANDSAVVFREQVKGGSFVGSSRVDLQACKLEYSIVSPK